MAAAAAAALSGHQNAAALFAAVYVAATPTPTTFSAVFIAISHAHVHHLELAGGQRGDDLFGGIAGGAAAAEDADSFAVATTSCDLYSALRFT